MRQAEKMRSYWPMQIGVFARAVSTGILPWSTRSLYRSMPCTRCAARISWTLGMGSGSARVKAGLEWITTGLRL